MTFLLPTLVFLAIASITDWKWHEVPDWLNYTFLAIGIGLSILSSTITQTWQPLIESITGFLLFGILGFTLYLIGQWGGGDVKTIAAVGSLVGLWTPVTHTGISFLVNLFPAAALYGTGWFLVLLSRHWKTVGNKLSQPAHKKQFWYLIPIILSLVLLFFVDNLFLKAGLLLFGMGVPLLLILTDVVSVVERIAFIKTITPNKLTEGDWLGSPVKYRGNIIVASGGTGVTSEEITKLKTLYSQKKIKKVVVKYGLPFVPAFLIALLLTILVGNVFMVFL